MSINLESTVASIFDSDNEPIFVGEIGKQFRIYSNIDLTGATSVIMSIKKPTGGSPAQWVASVDTNPYYATYTTVANDLNIAGVYYLSLNITISGKTLIGKSVAFLVNDQFYDGPNPVPYYYLP